MKDTLLITGGCGFIGANLVPRLINEGYRVRVYDNLSRGNIDFIGSSDDLEFIKGDIRDFTDLQIACSGVDGIIHLAAFGSVIESLEDPITNFDINGLGTLNVLEAARIAEVKKMIFASTGGALIGDAEPPVSEDSVARPKSPYGASKLTGEAYCNAFGQAFNLPVVILRFANIYGPVSAHKKGAITVFSKALMSGKPLVIYGDGTASRDFLHVDDLCNGIVLALRTDLVPATVLHLATGRETSIWELAEILMEVSGKTGHPIEFREQRVGEVHRNFANFDRASELLGFTPHTILEEGLLQTWQWFMSQGQAIINMETTDA